jgi:glycosyltransferase involved in cell wall biosynthesis
MDHSLPASDGYAIRAKYLLEAQVALGHEVTVLTSPSQGAAEEETRVGVSYRRSSYTRLERELVRGGAKHLVFRRAIRRRMRELLGRQSFDIVHAHTPFTVASAAMQEARTHRLPWIYEKRNLWEESARARGKSSGRWPWYQASKALDLWVTRRAGAVCTITQALKAHTVTRGVSPDSVFVVGNGVDTDVCTPRPAPAELRARCLGAGDFVLGFVGTFFSFEGLPMLVDAFAVLHGKYPRVRLVLVGDGEDKPQLEALVEKNRLQSAVWLPGRVVHDRALDFCAAMDVLVYPRRRSLLTEMISPLKPLEPMAMGRCVLASDVGGIRELIQDGRTGLLFRADSQRDLLRRLEELADRRLDVAALGARAREHVVACRQWRDIARAYDAAYHHALDRRARRVGALTVPKERSGDSSVP